MSPTAEEVDLTSETPPRKMKQALLPFGQSANRQNVSPKKGSDSGRKRKLSGEENIPTKKAARTEDGNEVEKLKSKSKLAQFAFKETSNEKTEADNEESTKRKGNKKDNSNLKQKEKRVNKEITDSVDDAKVSQETNEKKSSVIHGLLVNPLFKKSKKSKDKEGVNVDEDSVDFELVLESSTEEDIEKPGNMNLTEAEDASITSMTEEWAKFHENNDTDQSMEEMETSSTSKSGSNKKTKEDKLKEKEDKIKEKEEKLRQKQEERAQKEEEKAKAKAEKEKQKQLQKEEKEKKKEKTKEESKAPVPKVNPLARFLAKAKEQKAAVKPETVKAADNDVEIVEVKEATPLRTSPRKKVVEEVEKKEDVEPAEKTSLEEAPKATSTPLRTSPRKKVSCTPKTPLTDPARTQTVNIAKLKVQIHDLSDVMDKAVEDKDFLKAHEVKESIKKLEEEIKSMEADTSYVSQSLEALNSSKKQSPGPPTPKTPKASRNVSVVSTPGSAKAPNSGKKTKKEILEQERLAKKEALEKEKLAKKEALEKEKLAKKEAKDKEKAEKDKLKEIEKKAKEEERQEKERLKKEEKEKAEAEKLKIKQEKEEEKMRKKAEKEAEAKQKEEEKRLAEEAEKEKVKKEAQAFSSFFKKVEPKEVKETVPEVNEEDDAVGGFTPFRVKENMRLAPLVRADTEVAKSRIDSLDMPVGPDHMYLELLKTGYQAGKQGKTWPYEKVEEADDVEILDDEDDAEESDPEDDLDETNVNIIMRKGGDKSIKVPRAKLLKFHENRRPAYWGTWTKQSKFISGRRPFGRDEDRFDYEYDSDDDWEEEEEGESLSDDEKDKEDEEEDDYEHDEFFVPHGYLSDEEENKEEDEVMDPETAKQKQKLAAKEFEKEHKKKTQELKPRLWGTYWTGDDSLDTGAAALQLAKILGGYTGIVCAFNNNPIDTSFSKEVSSPMIIQQDEVTDSAKVGAKSQKFKNVPEEAVPDLIKLVHGNCNNKIFLAREFIAFWNRKTGFEPESEENATPSAKNNSLSKKKVVDKIQEISEYKKKPDGVGRCWMVKEEILTKYEISSNVCNDWSYILDQPNKNGLSEEAAGSRPGSPTNKISSPAPTNLITKFARPLTEEEKEEQRAKLEREAAAAKQKRDAVKAEQAAAKAEQIAKIAAAKAKQDQAKQSPLSSFTQALSEMQKKGQLNSGADKKTPVSMSPKVNVKRVALTTVTSGKQNPITAITSGKGLSSPVASLKRASSTPSPSIQASPILVKRRPGPVTTPTSTKTLTSSIKASPIAIKRKPGPTPASPSQLSFSGMIPDGISVSKIRSSPRKKPSEAECITIEDSN